MHRKRKKRLGQAGSYKQVRSLGSAAHRLTHESHVTLDFFTIDFNEEFSALSGAFCFKEMYSKTHFACIVYLNFLYFSLAFFLDRSNFT